MIKTKPPKVLFLTLRTFSITGGIEKVCRGIGYTLQHMHNEGTASFKMLSFYDAETDERYVSKGNFNGFRGSKARGTLSAIKAGINSDIVILSHINLCPAGLAIKLISPKTKVIMWAHGIEIWRKLNWVKKRFLEVADKVVAVSRYTSGTLAEMHSVAANKIQVIANGLDPYFQFPDLSAIGPPTQSAALENLKKKYSLQPGKKIFIALTRLKTTEKYKNYDKVIRILGALKKEGKAAYYLLCGNYDEAEQKRIMEIAGDAGMESEVKLTGFIPDESLAAHYLLADAFVLPSEKEGFGIAFAEAQACGLYVLAGNKDGSGEAVRNADAGMLVDPGDGNALKAALDELLIQDAGARAKRTIQEQAIQHFSFNTFQKNTRELILNYAN